MLYYINQSMKHAMALEQVDLDSPWRQATPEHTLWHLKTGWRGRSKRRPNVPQMQPWRSRCCLTASRLAAAPWGELSAAPCHLTTRAYNTSVDAAGRSFEGSQLEEVHQLCLPGEITFSVSFC